MTATLAPPLPLAALLRSERIKATTVRSTYLDRSLSMPMRSNW